MIKPHTLHKLRNVFCELAAKHLCAWEALSLTKSSTVGTNMQEKWIYGYDINFV